MKKTTYLFAAGLFSLAFLVLGLNSPTFAEENKTISISPAIERITLEPGESKTSSFRVSNSGEAGFKYKITVEPYQVTDYDYNVLSDVENSYTKIVDWIILSQESGYLDPGESAEIYYTINTPSDVPAGGQYAILKAAFVNNSGGTINVSGAVGEIIYATVNGATRTTGHIVENKITGFSFNPPITASTIVENAGNVDAELKSSLRITSVFTGKEAYSNVENPQSTIILPETKRNVKTFWEGSPRLGVFKVELKTSFIDETQTIVKTVVICPVWLIFLVLLAIAAVVLKVVISSKKKSRRRSGITSKFSL